MSVPPDPSITPVNAVYNLVIDLVTVAGLAGVAVPAFLQNPQIEVQIAGALVGLFGIAASFFAKKKMANALNTANARLAVALKKGR